MQLDNVLQEKIKISDIYRIISRLYGKKACKKVKTFVDVEMSDQPGVEELASNPRKPPLRLYFVPTQNQGNELVARFLDEKCLRDPDAVVNASVLYRAFNAWLEAVGVSQTPVSQKRFGTLLRKNSLKKYKFGDYFYTFIKLV